MVPRLTKIYTRTGDDGTTGLSDGSRVPKDSLRIAAIGDIDELNSMIGMILAHALSEAVHICLMNIQHDLFNLGGELSLPKNPLLTEGDTARLERLIDTFNSSLPPLEEFILPGGGHVASACHLARAICRRAERKVVALARIENVNAPVCTYLNRLSDLLFVVCRVLARDSGQAEVYWQPPRAGDRRRE